METKKQDESIWCEAGETSDRGRGDRGTPQGRAELDNQS